MIKSEKIPRLRIFAGPNGSGKSTVINDVRNFRKNGHPIDLGIYINADDIALELNNGILFNKYKLNLSDDQFKSFVLTSGLINDNFTEEEFSKSYVLQSNKIISKDKRYIEHLAQLISNFLINKLLEHKVKFSFETVFSHKSKLDIMKRANEAGYKVYFYFVATESPEINIERVRARTEKGGHYVPEEKIKNRYYRTMNFLYAASQLAYQAFYFDNSVGELDMFANFKIVNGKKQWSKESNKMFPEWFKSYYSEKI